MAKALLKQVEAAQGSAAADVWLRGLRTERDDLEDETRPMPLEALHTALKAFADVLSRDAIPSVWPYLIAPDNLGGWMRVLRGTTGPVEAFNRLDSSDSEYGRTTRWESVASGPDHWRGRVHIAHDPALETDGLLRLARMAELACVPALFGFGPGAVAHLDIGLPTRTGLSQEFEVRWTIPQPMRVIALGGAAGAALGVLPLAYQQFFAALWSGAAGALVGGLTGAAMARDRARRAESHAQSMRVRALERSLLLRETRESQAMGPVEGHVVAGQFRIVKRMGSGASGVIYEAVRISDGLPVAIKLLRTAAAHDVVASDRLRREAEALRLAWHPNVVEVLDYGVLGDGTAYLAMELLHGQSLAVRLRDKTRLPPAELLPIATQVCDALVAVHAAGVVHRDLKPSNIFLAAPAGDVPGPERVKLLDFGIARVEWEETRITNMGSPVGTPGYMSPEQEAGGEVDARSDIFALGACLYECLVGEPPPPTPSGLWTAGGAPGGGPGARMDSGLHAAVKLIPPSWRKVINRAMAPLPRDRYADARAMATALRELAEEMARAEASASR